MDGMPKKRKEKCLGDSKSNSRCQFYIKNDGKRQEIGKNIYWRRGTENTRQLF
jgi:hypothetical protein